MSRTHPAKTANGDLNITKNRIQKSHAHNNILKHEGATDCHRYFFFLNFWLQLKWQSSIRQ
jgi:hypothetical protein